MLSSCSAPPRTSWVEWLTLTCSLCKSQVAFLATLLTAVTHTLCGVCHRWPHSRLWSKWCAVVKIRKLRVKRKNVSLTLGRRAIKGRPGSRGWEGPRVSAAWEARAGDHGFRMQGLLGGKKNQSTSSGWCKQGTVQDGYHSQGQTTAVSQCLN